MIRRYCQNTEEWLEVEEDWSDEDAPRPKDDYEGGVCPDCGQDIPDEAEYGEACSNCDHVWNPVQEND